MDQRLNDHYHVCQPTAAVGLQIKRTRLKLFAIHYRNILLTQKIPKQYNTQPQTELTIINAGSAINFLQETVNSNAHQKLYCPSQHTVIKNSCVPS